MRDANGAILCRIYVNEIRDGKVVLGLTASKSDITIHRDEIDDKAFPTNQEVGP